MRVNLFLVVTYLCRTFWWRPSTAGNSIGDPLPTALACVVSISVLFQSKERPRNKILGFGRARNETRANFSRSPCSETARPFFAWSLLRNSTETLATQANAVGKRSPIEFPAVDSLHQKSSAEVSNHQK